MHQIILAEDNTADQDLIRLALKEIDSNYNLTCVSDGKMLLEHLNQTNPYDLVFILLDLNMPGMNGTEVLEKLINEERFHTIPVIIFSSSALKSDVITAYEIGANAYVRKPENFDDLKRVLGTIIDFWGEINVLAKPVHHSY